MRKPSHGLRFRVYTKICKYMKRDKTREYKKSAKNEQGKCNNHKWQPVSLVNFSHSEDQNPKSHDHCGVQAKNDR